MSALQIVFSVLLLITSLLLIVSVLLQKWDPDGMSALTGGSSSSFFGKNKAKTMEGRMAQLTKGSAIAFVVLGLVLIFI